jgi:hypothetical protein
MDSDVSPYVEVTAQICTNSLKHIDN